MINTIEIAPHMVAHGLAEKISEYLQTYDISIDDWLQFRHDLRTLILHELKRGHE